MKTTNLNQYLIATLLLMLGACRTIHKTTDLQATPVNIARYWENQFDFDDIQLRGKATITQDNKKNTVSMHIKMKKDSIVWAKFSLFGFGVNALITPDSFFMINSITQEYMKYDHAFLEQYLGFKPQVNQLQNMLIGNAAFSQSLYTAYDQNRIIARAGLTKNSIQMDALFHTLVSEIITSDTTRSASIRYSTYEKVGENSVLPKMLIIAINQASESLKLELNYQNISQAPIRDFIFKIPTNYRRK